MVADVRGLSREVQDVDVADHAGWKVRHVELDLFLCDNQRVRLHRKVSIGRCQEAIDN